MEGSIATMESYESVKEEKSMSDMEDYGAVGEESSFCAMGAS